MIYLLSYAKLMIMGRYDPPNFSEGIIQQVDNDILSEFIPFFVIDHIDVLGMRRLLTTYDDLVDMSASKYESRQVQKQDPLVQLEASEITQIKEMQGTFNRDVAFDMDDDILVLPNFINRKQNQLIVINTHTMLDVCMETDIAFSGRQNAFKRHLDKCSFIVEESCIREECMINFA